MQRHRLCWCSISRRAFNLAGPVRSNGVDFAVNSDERLRLNSCLDDYKLQEVIVAAADAKLSAEDLAGMSKSTTTMSKSGKSALRATASETGLHVEKKKRGIFGKFFGKSKKGSVSLAFTFYSIVLYK